jgi:DNA polymerase-3 subunit beta
MKFIVSTTALLRQLQVMNGVISTNTVLPILEGFLFEIEPGKLRISATDLETSMTSDMAIETRDKGKIAIPARILVDTLKTLPEQPLAISIDEKTYAVEITTDSGKFKLSGENGDDFPRIPAAENVSALTMPSPGLQRAINKTLFAVSTDELRPAMTGVLFQLDADGVTFVGTDAHKLVRYQRKDTASTEQASFIVPRKALSLLKSALPGDDTQVSISYNQSNAFFRFHDLELICRLIDARYPDYNAVIPRENPNNLLVNRAALLNTLKRVMIFSNKTTHQVMLRIAGSELQISAKDLDFSNEASERLDCEYHGEDMEIGFNARFLLEMINAMDTDQVRFELSTPTRAGLLMPSETTSEESVLMLVMPVMLNH